MSVLAKLAKAREQFMEMKVKKTGFNSYIDYHYYTLDDIVPPGLKCLHDQGLAASPMSCTPNEASMTIVDTESGDMWPITIPLGKASMKGLHDVQQLGAALSYSRRYLWLQLLEIVEPDWAELSEPKKDLKPTDPATEEQMKVLRKAWKDGELSAEAATTLKTATDSGKGVTVAMASALIESLYLKEEKK